MRRMTAAGTAGTPCHDGPHQLTAGSLAAVWIGTAAGQEAASSLTCRTG